MDKNEVAPPVYKFASFTFDTGTRQLLRNRTKIDIAPLPAKILECFLVKNKGTIHKKEIIEFAWSQEPDGNSFHQAIKALRTTLGDSRENKKSPWKFIDNPKTNIYSLKVKAKRKKSKKEILSIFKYILVASTLTSAVAVAAVRLSVPNAYTATNHQLLTNAKGEVQNGTYSESSGTIVHPYRPLSASDWTLKAITADGEEKHIVFSYDLEDLNAKSHAEPAFSPNGERLAWVVTDYYSYCGLYAGDLSAHSDEVFNIKKILDCNENYFARSPQWRTDDKILVSLPQGDRLPNAIFEVDVTTGERLQITQAFGVGYGDYHLAYNRELDAMAHVRRSSRTTSVANDIHLYDFKTRKGKKLKSYKNNIYSVAWTGDNKVLAKANNGFELISSDGKTIPVHSSVNQLEHYPFKIGPNRFGYVQGSLFQKDLVIINLKTGQKTSEFSSVHLDLRPVFAELNDYIAYVSTRYNVRQVFLANSENPRETPKQITQYKDRASIEEIAISPSGDKVAISRMGVLTVVDSTGKEISSVNGLIKGMAFSDDGESLVFSEMTTSGPILNRLKLGESEQLTRIGRGYAPRNHKGDLYFFRAEQGSIFPALYKQSNEGWTKKIAHPEIRILNSNSYDLLDDMIYFTSRKPEGVTLFSQNLTTGEKTEIRTLPGNEFSLSGDGSKVIATVKIQAQNNISHFDLKELD